VLDYKDMPIEHIVVDGSNIATEGRSLPSLTQLEEAVAELRRDHPNAEITVIVDATFAHRIDPSELARFEQAALRGEYVHPPAGAIGRGDAFLLRVAEKVDGTVLSNDSFQEFHGEHPWLFERGRLLGATPVPGIGWIFSPRQPVRGPKSHQAVRETVQAKKRVTKAIAVATKEVVKPVGQSQGAGASAGGSGRRRRGGGTAPAKLAAGARETTKPVALAVNDPLAFISFIAEHRLGELLEGEVEGYTSHGAVIRAGEMRCYIPLANLGDPPPRSAREVLKRHERGQFVLTALDPQRRGAELALPGIAYVSGHPREETVAAEVRLAKSPRARSDGSRPQAGDRTRTAPKKVAPVKAASQQPAAKETGDPPARSGRSAPAPARAAAASEKLVPTRSEVATTSKLAGKKATTEESPVRKVPAKQVAIKGAPVKKAAAKRAAVKKAPATKAPRTGTDQKSVLIKSVPTKKAPSKKVAAAAEAVATRQATPRKSPARTAPVRRAELANGTRKATASKSTVAKKLVRARQDAPAQNAAGGRRSPLTKARTR
jgi:hypothetical protein